MNKIKMMIMAAIVCAAAYANANPYTYPVRYVPVTKVVAVQNAATNPWRGAARTPYGNWVGAPAHGNAQMTRTGYMKPRRTPNYRVPVYYR